MDGVQFSFPFASTVETKFQFSRPAVLEFVCASSTNCKIPLYVYGRLISPITAITKEHRKKGLEKEATHHPNYN